MFYHNSNCLSVKFFVVIALLGSPFMAMASDEETVCSTTKDCKDGEYCSKEVGKCESEGVCLKKSEVCTMDYRPVCGCDGNTYPNRCAASSKGIPLKTSEECVK